MLHVVQKCRGKDFQVGNVGMCSSWPRIGYPSQQDMAQDWLPKSTLRKRNGEEHKTREGKKRSGVMKVMSMERIGASHFLPNRTPLLPTR